MVDGIWLKGSLTRKAVQCTEVKDRANASEVTDVVEAKSKISVRFGQLILLADDIILQRSIAEYAIILLRFEDLYAYSDWTPESASHDCLHISPWCFATEQNVNSRAAYNSTQGGYCALIAFLTVTQHSN